jgi:glycosyltransferase involved in cell wall biosynthesis
MQRVGIDLRITYHAQTGFHRYARGIVDSLRRFPQPDLRFVLLRHADDRAPVAGESVESVALTTPIFCADEGERLRREVLPLGLDIVHFPFSLFPARIAPRVILTVHDLTCARMPQCIEERYLQFYLETLRRGSEADTILAPSDQIAGELVEYGLPAARIRRCYPLTPFEGGAFYEADTVDEALLDGLSAHPFLLSVGSLEPRKNHLATLAAFTAVRRRTNERVRLVLAGCHGWLAEPFLQALEGHPYRDDVCLARDAGDGTLRRLLRDCRLFLSLSSYEGFGLPVIEALAAGACVLSGPTPSLSESGFPRAGLLDPNDPDAVADRIVELLADAPARTALADASRAAVGAFYRSCDASRLVQVYRW